MGEDVITIALKQREERVITLLQSGRIPSRPEWMQGEDGYVESVARTCPKCESNDVWRGPWCHFAEAYYVLVKMEPPVKHSGRKRHAACSDCGEFWVDVQAIPYDIQDWVDV